MNSSMDQVPGTGSSTTRSAIDHEMAGVYDELRRLARSYLRRNQRDGTLQPTELVHEVYLRLVEWNGFQCRSRVEFFGAAASVMRNVLAAAGRRRRTLRRGADPVLVPMAEVGASEELPMFEIVQLDIALGKLAEMDPAAARVVELRVFGGLTLAESAEFLGASTATVKRRWLVARAWLFRELGAGTIPGAP